MSIKNSAALSSEIANDITNQTAPESITPTLLGNDLQDFIDSFYNRLDDALTPAPINMTKAQLVTAIGANALVDKQYITITDRADTFPLVVQAQGNSKVSPFGIWINTGVPLAVIMTYTGAGELFVFSAFVDSNGNLNLPNQIIIADASKGAGKVLVSDANGKGTWMAPAISQSGVITPSILSGATPLMAGLAGSITPTKSGNVLISITGAYTFSDTTGNIIFSLKTGTGTAPTNGSGSVGTTQQSKSFLALVSGNYRHFTMEFVATGLTVGTPYWIDLALSATAGGSVSISQVSITAIEQ